MRLIPLFAAALLAASPVALARNAPTQAEQAVSGYDVILSLAAVRGVALGLPELRLVRPATAAANNLARRLCLPPDTFDRLVAAGASPATGVLVTESVLESATCRPYDTASVQGVVGRNPALAQVSPDELRSLLSNPGQVNNLANAALVPVTARTPNN